MLDLKLNDDHDVKSGDLVLSEPMLRDPNFSRTVVLICEHSRETGTFGFVLNKSTSLSINDLVNGIPQQFPIFYGGPVGQDKLFIIHRIESLPDSKSVKPSLCWGGNIEELLIRYELGQINGKDFRFVLGYSGWACGQLEDEVKSDSWIIVRNFEIDVLFECNPLLLWQTLLNKLGGKYKLFAKFPIDPKYN